MTAEQMQQYRALAARNESAVPLCSEYQRAIGALLAEVERLQAAWSAEHDAYIRADEQARMAKREAERLRDEIEDIRYAAWEESMGEDL